MCASATGEVLQNEHANDRHRARHVINVLKAFQKSDDEIKEYKRLLESVRTHLKRNCKDLPKVFFHKRTMGRTWICPARILQIMMTIIGVLLRPAVGVSLLSAMNTTIFKTFAFSWGAANTGKVFGQVSTASATAAFLKKISIIHVNPLLRGFRFPRPRRFLLAEDSDSDSDEGTED
jgi:hypothetical protein